MSKKKEFSPFSSIAILTQLGLGMITPIIGGVLLGNYLDNRFAKNSLFLIILTIIGAAAAFRYLLVMGTKLSRKEVKKNNEKE
jgi:F0F1-type ATP synthase assembly protein I